MKTIIVHGIGDSNPGWTEYTNAAHLLEVKPEDIIEYNYESVFEERKIPRLIRGVLRLTINTYMVSQGIPGNSYVSGAADTVGDYLFDILSYFLAKEARHKILTGLRNLIVDYPNANVIGHSLGSIVSYETMMLNPELAKGMKLITTGSPLGSGWLSPIVKWFLKVPNKGDRPNVKSWHNLYGSGDVLAGIIKDLGCNDEDQYKIRGLHRIYWYLPDIAQRKLLS